jgi:hypothetical protein
MEGIQMIFNPRASQWWNAAPSEKFQAYYMTLRIHYEMPALAAFNYAKEQFGKHPEFMADMIGTLKKQLHPNSTPRI